MIPLIDGDILRYELGFSGEFPDPNWEGIPAERPTVILDPEYVFDLLDAKIALICDEVEATEKPVIYLTNDRHITRIKGQLGEEIELLPNFREKVAVTKPYKGGRKSVKPFHFVNITLHLLLNYNCIIANGLEADDLMSIDQCHWNKCNDIGYDNAPTIICSRDKDLRQVPGMHYSWECGNQAAIGPIETDSLGWIEQYDHTINKADGSKEIEKRVRGYGETFFYYQSLTGDNVDNIPGVRGIGPAKAFKIIEECKGSARSLFDGVCAVYKETYGDGWKEYAKEQFNLLWMIRGLYVNGEPIYYRPPTS